DREVAAAGEQHDQQYGEEKTRHRIADDDDRAGPHVEPAAVAHRFSDTERDRYQVGDQGGPQPDRDRDRQFVLDQIDDLAVAEEAGAEIEGDVVADHQQKALERRLVEAILLFELLDQRRIEAPRSPVTGVTGDGLGLEFAGAAADPLGGAHSAALEPRDQLLDRAARRGLHDHEIDHHDREQGRDDQRDAADRVGDLARPSPVTA